MRWRSRMRLLVVSKLDPSARAVSTITNYVRAGKDLGHEVALFGEQSSAEPVVPYSLDVRAFDFVIFVLYDTKDFPHPPYPARLLHRLPTDRTVFIHSRGPY